MSQVRFIYQGDHLDIARELMCKKVCEYVSSVLSLPNTIEIVFAKMNKSDYGQTIVNSRFPNRIHVNESLRAKEMPYVLVHELLHLNQIKEGLLSSTSNGMYIWRGKIHRVREDLDYKSYVNLPWEQDVIQKYKPLLNETIESMKM
jgi:hypothetical protein